MTIFALMVGARLAGVVGAILAVPVVLVLQSLLHVFFFLGRRNRYNSLYLDDFSSHLFREVCVMGDIQDSSAECAQRLSSSSIDGKSR